MFEQEHFEFGSSHIVGFGVLAFCEFVVVVCLGLNLCWDFAGDCL